MPYQIGLTGGIASGKTLISDEFSRLGVPVIDTDIIAHEIVEQGQPALLEIVEAFGDTVIGEDGRLKRKALRNLIFSDENAKVRLESILHPKIRQQVFDEIKEVNYPYCIIVIPLLTESGGYQNLDRVLLVDVDPDVQIARLMSRDGSSVEQANRALASQASREDRLANANDVLDNSSSPQVAYDKVAQLHQRYLQLAQRDEF